MYTCIQWNHFAVYLTLTQYYKSTILKLKKNRMLDTCKYSNIYVPRLNH